MNRLIVAAWMVFGVESGIAIPYDAMEKCNAALAVARKDQAKLALYPLCVPGNSYEGKK